MATAKGKRAAARPLKEKNINVRVSKGLYDQVQALADEQPERESVSKMARQLMREALKARGIEPSQ